MRYATGAAAGGWVTGIAIDLIPLLFTALLLSTHAPGRLDDPVQRRRSGEGERGGTGSDTDEGPGPGGPGAAAAVVWPRAVRPS